MPAGASSLVYGTPALANADFATSQELVKVFLPTGSNCTEQSAGSAITVTGVERVATALGDRIPYACTVNEPQIVALGCYLNGEFPPGHRDIGEAVFTRLLSMRLELKKGSTGALAGMMRRL